MSEAKEQASSTDEDKSLEERRFLFEQRQHTHAEQMDNLKIELQQKELLQKRSDPLLMALLAESLQR